MQQLSATTIIRTLEKQKAELRNLGVKRIGLFGSFLKGKGTKQSDLDFIVYLQEPTFDHYFDLKFLLERLFKRKVDLVVEDSLKPALAYVKEEARYAEV